MLSKQIYFILCPVSGAHLVLQVIVIAVMQEKAENVAGVDHGIYPTLLKLLAEPALHWPERLEEGHL